MWWIRVALAQQDFPEVEAWSLGVRDYSELEAYELMGFEPLPGFEPGWFDKWIAERDPTAPQTWVRGFEFVGYTETPHVFDEALVWEVPLGPSPTLYFLAASNDADGAVREVSLTVNYSVTCTIGSVGHLQSGTVGPITAHDDTAVYPSGLLVDLWWHPERLCPVGTVLRRGDYEASATGTNYAGLSHTTAPLQVMHR